VEFAERRRRSPAAKRRAACAEAERSRWYAPADRRSSASLICRIDAPVRISRVFRPQRLWRGADLRDLADEDLMALVPEGHARAFEVVFDRHAGPAFSLAYRVCGRRTMAEEVVQEAFLSLWRSNARYDRARGSVRTWVLGIVHNRAIDALRRNTGHDKHRASDEGIEERFEAKERTDVEVARRDEAREVRSALETLPAEQQKVIELAYFGGFTHTEIATMLETPVGTIKGRMRLGLEKMRNQLSGWAEATT
jgi:RNA polymerase sigma-70 factor (ECF subfamily)